MVYIFQMIEKRKNLCDVYVTAGIWMTCKCTNCWTSKGAGVGVMFCMVHTMVLEGWNRGRERR